MKVELIFMGMKQKNIFLKKEIKMADSKKLRSSSPPIFNIFSQKFQEICPWVCRINLCEGH